MKNQSSLINKKKKKEVANKCYFFFAKGRTVAVNNIPALLSFILPAPMPVKGSLTKGSAINETFSLALY
jgi:hypothetical protein